MPQERETGVVKHYDPEKGFGFIGRSRGEDVFVHRNDVARAGLSGLNQGDRVSFTIKQTQRGWQADNLSVEGAQSNQRPPAPARPNAATSFRFGPDYLAEGYFEAKNGKRYLRPEVIDTTAMDVAKVLGTRGMKSNQLRRFFNKARGIESKLTRDRDFEAIKMDIYGFKRDVAYQVGRKLVPDDFQQFINRNVELAVQDEESFRKGFLQHFESVLAYFVYVFRDQ